MSHKEADGTIIYGFKYQVTKINLFTKNMESEMQDYINRLREMTYTLSHIRQGIKYMEKLERKISIREDERYMRDSNWLEGIMDKEG